MLVWIVTNHEKEAAKRSLCQNSTYQPLYQGDGKREDNKAKKSCAPYVERKRKFASFSIEGDAAFFSSFRVKIEHFFMRLFFLIGS